MSQLHDSCSIYTITSKIGHKSNIYCLFNPLCIFLSYNISYIAHKCMVSFLSLSTHLHSLRLLDVAVLLVVVTVFLGQIFLLIVAVHVIVLVYDWNSLSVALWSCCTHIRNLV